ncbi:high mobility group box domain-containing protein, partial [Chytriomyces sp. MP71]
TKKEKQTRKKKDPNAPKRYPSGFQLFMTEITDKERAKNPAHKVPLQMEKAAEAWKTMSEKEKKKYLDKSAALKTEYEAQMAEYGNATDKPEK